MEFLRSSTTCRPPTCVSISNCEPLLFSYVGERPYVLGVIGFWCHLWNIRQAGKFVTCPPVIDNQWLDFSVCVLCQSSPASSLTDYFAIFFLDLNEAVPETERLDSKALKTRAQLSVKNRRQRPTRTRLYDSVSSTDGEDSLEPKVSSPPAYQISSKRDSYFTNRVCSLFGKNYSGLYLCLLNLYSICYMVVI